MAVAKKVFRFKSKDTGNPKLGSIPTFSIDRHHSCKQRSSVCQEICYGGYNRLIWKPSLVRLVRYYTLTRSANFAASILASLAGLHPPAFRIHDLGDFYSRIYIRKWLKIIGARRDIKFFAYTRMWRSPTLVLELLRLASEPNMTLFLSLDHSMLNDPIPPELARLPRAWLATDDTDIPPRHLHINVVFRNLRNKLTPLENLNQFGAMVCPAETGRGAKTTCERCMYCPSRCKEQHAGGIENQERHRHVAAEEKASRIRY